MNAIILTAGEGTRLRPLTFEKPKCLIPIAGKPILSYQLDALWAAGAHRVLIVTGHLGHQVRDFVSKDPRISTLDNKEYKTTNILYSFSLAADLMDCREDTIVLAGDVVFSALVLERLVRVPNGNMVLCVNKKKCGEEEVKVEIERGQVLRLGKALDPANAYGEFMGIFFAKAEAFAETQREAKKMMVQKKASGYLFDMINSLIDQKKISAAVFEVNEMPWEEIDFADDIERASRRFSECV